MIESKYYMEAKENTKAFEASLAENNKKWEVSMTQMEEELSKYRRLIVESEKKHEDEIKSLKKSFEQQLDNKDTQWKSVLIDCENKARRELESFKDRLNLESEAREIGTLVKIEANQERAQALFDKKLKKYEKQVSLIIERFDDKKLKYEGALEEVRRQLRECAELNEKKSTYLHEEVLLKEKRVTSILGKLQQYNTVTSELNRWRDIAKELATMVVNTSLQVGN